MTDELDPELIDQMVREKEEGLKLLTEMVADNKTTTPSRVAMEEYFQEPNNGLMFNSAVARVGEINLPNSYTMIPDMLKLMHTGFAMGWAAHEKWDECKMLEKLYKVKEE